MKQVSDRGLGVGLKHLTIKTATYMKRNVVSHSYNHHCYRSATMGSFYTVVEVLFCTAVNNTNVLNCSLKVLDIFV